MRSSPASAGVNAAATSIKFRPHASAAAPRIAVASKRLTTQSLRSSAIYVATLGLAVQVDLNFTTDVTLRERAIEPAT